MLLAVILFLGIGPSLQQRIYYPFGPPINATPELCKGGYFWDDLDPLYPDNCCSYKQCNEDYTAAFQRFCAPPLVWNRESMTCDWQDNVLDCVPENETCWAPPENLKPEPENCTAFFENQCCQIGEFEDVTQGEGLLFSKINETFYTFEYEEFPTPQQCPWNGSFNLDTCCCESHHHAAPSCLHWPMELTPISKTQKIPIFEGGCRFRKDSVPVRTPGFSLECMNDGNPASMDYFSQAWWGDSLAMGVWFRCCVPVAPQTDPNDDPFEGCVDDQFPVCGDGVVYSNGQPGVNPTLELTIDSNTNQATFLIADRFSRKVFMKVVDLIAPVTEWNFFLFQMQGTQIWAYWGTEAEHQASYDDTSLLDTDFRFVAEGNKCPMKLVAFRGQIDQLLICAFPLTNDEIDIWRNNPNVHPEPRWAVTYRQLLGIQIFRSTTTTTTSPTTTPRRRGKRSQQDGYLLDTNTGTKIENKAKLPDKLTNA